MSKVTNEISSTQYDSSGEVNDVPTVGMPCSIRTEY